MLEKIVLCSLSGEKEQLFCRMRECICRMDVLEQLVWLREHGYEGTVPQVMMGKEEIVALSKDSLCTIGCHTVSHCFLTEKVQSDIYKEIMECKICLENMIGKEVTHFAYPYGDYDDEVKQAVGELGFYSATTTSGMPIRKTTKSVFEIPRVTLIQFPL